MICCSLRAPTPQYIFRAEYKKSCGLSGKKNRATNHYDLCSEKRAEALFLTLGALIGVQNR